MQETEEHGSEVARLQARIQAEYESAQNGFSGLMSGTARHDFINARMEQISQLRGCLQDLVGDQALVLMTTIQEKSLDCDNP